MKAVLIFDNVNDLLYSKWDVRFIERLQTFGDDNENLGITDSYNVSQLLSPIITSQRVMAAQFGNTYTSMQCKDDTTIVFDEWLDHVFLIISEEDIDDAHRELLDCKTLVQHICGQNINLLRSPVYQKWLSELLESRGKGDSIPGASGVIGESGATVAALTALKNAAKEVKSTSHQHYHLLLFVGDKLLALYSSKGSEDLQPPDIILLSLQSIAAQEHWCDAMKTENCKDNSHLPWLSEENSAIINLCAGNTGSPCAPHSMHIAEIAERVIFIMLLDMDLRDISIPTHTSYQILSNLRRLLLQRNLEMLPTTLDSLETALKKTSESLRGGQAGLSARVGSRLLELRRACASTAPLTPDTAAAALHTALNMVLELLRPSIPTMNIETLLNELRTALAPYVDFLKVRAQRYFGLGSAEYDGRPLSLHKYVEEYPGLIHFVYVDRGSGRFLAPDLADCGDLVSPEFISSCIRRCLRYWREGYGGWSLAARGRRVSAVRWRGGPAPPPAPHPAALRALPPPGDILAAFYRQMSELSPGGGAVKELLCIHLGLVPPATALQQARRLAHSLADQQQDAKNLL